MAICVLLHSDLSSDERLGETLRGYGHRIESVRLHRGEPVPVDLDGIDGIISCGGSQAPDDDSLPWMADELALLRAAHERQMPVVGICLGNQLLARALGGSTGKMDGIEFGWHDVELNHLGRENPIHAGIGWTTKQFEYHHQQITGLPAGASLLASSAQCKVQAWTADLRTYGFQYHPEITTEKIELWLADEPGLLDEAGLTREQFDKQTAEFFPHFKRTTDRLFESIALTLMPVDRRYSGLLKDLHH